MLRKLTKVVTLFIVVGTLGIGSPERAAAEGIDWSKFMGSSNAISAIAAAMSWVENCGKPFSFSERFDFGALWLSVSCIGSETDPGGTVIIEFRQHPEGKLVPHSFQHIG